MCRPQISLASFLHTVLSRGGVPFCLYASSHTDKDLICTVWSTSTLAEHTCKVLFGSLPSGFLSVFFLSEHVKYSPRRKLLV